MMKKRQKIIPWAAVTLIVLAAAAALYLSFGRNAIQGGRGETGKESQTEVKTEFTEEEKAQLESQTGVTVNDEGAIEIDIGAVMEEEASVAISRDEAESRVLEQLGEGAQIESAGLREYEGEQYWVIRASKGGEVRQIWLNAENGEELVNQEE